MLLFLDGVTNSVQNRNENFGREVMELFTVGRGEYTQDDVVAASRAFTGWVVDVPGRPGSRARGRVRDPAVAVRASSPAATTPGSRRCSAGPAPFDLDGALDVLLDHPSTAPRIAAKLYTELVGLVPDDQARAPGSETRSDPGSGRSCRWSTRSRTTPASSRARDARHEACARRSRSSSGCCRRSPRAGSTSAGSGAVRVRPSRRRRARPASVRRCARSATCRSCRRTSVATRRGTASSARTSSCTRSTCCRCSRRRPRSRATSARSSRASACPTSATTRARWSRPSATPAAGSPWSVASPEYTVT